MKSNFYLYLQSGARHTAASSKRRWLPGALGESGKGSVGERGGERKRKGGRREVFMFKRNHAHDCKLLSTVCTGEKASNVT